MITKESILKTKEFLMRNQNLYPETLDFFVPESIFEMIDDEAKSENKSIDEWAYDLYKCPAKIHSLRKLKKVKK